jgi:hypothetical protein
MYRKLLLLFVITLLVITSGCTTTVPDSQPSVQPTTGSLEISSTPQGSEIYLDGVYRGTTPSTIPEVSNGTHKIELRYREYNSWSKSVEIQRGSKSYVDATLSPIVTQTSVPTTDPTARPTTPMLKTVVGCWKFEHSIGNATIAYTYDLQSDGTGWMYGTKTSPTKIESMNPESVTWSKDPNSAMVTILEANPRDPADPDKWVLTYDENADILDGGEKGQVFMIYVRVPC